MADFENTLQMLINSNYDDDGNLITPTWETGEDGDGNDDYRYVDIIDRQIKLSSPEPVMLIEGDSYSQVFTFRIKRYIDKVDLTQMVPIIKVLKTGQDVGEICPTTNHRKVNAIIGEEETSSECLIFDWYVPGSICTFPGNYNICVSFNGEIDIDNTTKPYVYQSDTISLQVKEGLNIAEDAAIYYKEKWYDRFVTDLMKQAQGVLGIETLDINDEAAGQIYEIGGFSREIYINCLRAYNSIVNLPTLTKMKELMTQKYGDTHYPNVLLTIKVNKEDEGGLLMLKCPTYNGGKSAEDVANVEPGQKFQDEYVFDKSGVYTVIVQYVYDTALTRYNSMNFLARTFVPSDLS